MSSSALPRPGEEFGPCHNERCGHVDCEANRKIAKANCETCGKPIGYDRHFFQSDGWTKFEHAACLMERVA